MAYEQIESVLRIATPQLAAQKGKQFNRTIQVDTGIKDVKVGKQLVRVHPDFATSGNPVEVCMRIIDICEDFDTRAERWRIKRLKFLQQQLEDTLAEISHLAGDSGLASAVEKATGIGDKTPWHV